MQKLVVIIQPDSSDCSIIEERYLNDGWIIKNMLEVDKRLVILLEKETRKEKLEHLNNL